MKTERINISTDTWVKVIDAATSDFLIENETFAKILITIVDDGEIPEANAPGHLLKGREAFVRITTGDVFAKAVDVDGSVVVTVDG